MEQCRSKKGAHKVKEEGPELLCPGPSSCPHSPECVEGRFSEVHIQESAYTCR